MKSIRLAAFAVLLIGCGNQAIIKASLSTVAALASARGDAAVSFVKIDNLKQAEFQTRGRNAPSVADLEAVQAEFKAYKERGTKTLLALDKLGDCLRIVSKGLEAGGNGKVDLIAALAAFNELQHLLDGFGIKIPGVF